MREQRDIELVEGGVRVESMNTYADDQPSISQHLVCKPANRNITGEPFRAFRSQPYYAAIVTVICM